ncbi:hypothetical protein N658DRAFT_503963 [Parathielavia hyrcaniae]|uniref:SRR1-like domain-containing protein n=1 Tax=Parathielavia hyrcaniae TaxID=113614 RepID=A0AAN6T6L7_9PEZI|nr:hypothetical protein N658DRAFT_503963 [Parathielavia hyrcaniae]
MVQHALVLVVRDAVEKAGHRAPGTIKCYAQDPRYVPLDEQLLGQAGITVLDDPRAWLQVDEGSVVVGICPTIAFEDIIADIARPVAMVMQDPSTGRPISPRTEAMLTDEYVKLDFDEHEEFTWGVVFVKKAAMRQVDQPRHTPN